MSSPIRREADLARLAAREHRLSLVMQILSAREAEYRRARQPTPRGLRQSIAQFGGQLGDVHRRQAELGAERRTSQPSGRSARFDRAASGTTVP